MKYYFSLIILFLLACSEVSNDSSSEIIVDFENSEMISFNDVIKNVRVIPLETTESSLISRISKMVRVKDSIYVLDYLTREILIFGVKGEFINNLGKSGEGPNNYKTIQDFDVLPNGNIDILDRFGKIYTYNQKGELNAVERYSPPEDIPIFSSFKRIKENNIAFFQYHHPSDLFFLYDSNTKERLFSAIINPDINRSFGMSPVNHIFLKEGVLNYFDFFRSEMYQLDKKFQKMYSIKKINFSKKKNSKNITKTKEDFLYSNIQQKKTLLILSLVLQTILI